MSDISEPAADAPAEGPSVNPEWIRQPENVDLVHLFAVYARHLADHLGAPE